MTRQTRISRFPSLDLVALSAGSNLFALSMLVHNLVTTGDRPLGATEQHPQLHTPCHLTMPVLRL